MLGWILTFALLVIAGICMMLAGFAGAGAVSIKLATIVFSALFFACILTRIARHGA